jgi:hypothetical protein
MISSLYLAPERDDVALNRMIVEVLQYPEFSLDILLTLFSRTLRNMNTENSPVIICNFPFLKSEDNSDNTSDVSITTTTPSILDQMYTTLYNGLAQLNPFVGNEQAREYEQTREYDGQQKLIFLRDEMAEYKTIINLLFFSIVFITTVDSCIDHLLFYNVPKKYELIQQITCGLLFYAVSIYILSWR